MPSRPRNDHERAPADLVHLHDTTLTTDSRRVAKHFGKRHDNVLRAYAQIQADLDPEFNRLNFEAAEELDAKGEARRVVRMTKDGFMLLAMGFTGPKAMATKVAFINAFNAMADQLQRIGMSLWSQRLELEKRDATTFMWASFGSRRMHERRRELPSIKGERARLEAEMQPGLFQLPAHLTPKGLQ